MLVDRFDCLPGRCGGDAQAQRREGIERMRRRETQWHAGTLRLPLHQAIGEFAPARYFGRTDRAEVFEDRAEGDGYRRDLDPRPPLPDTGQLQIRKRRDEIEVPGRVHGEGVRSEE